MLLVTSEQLDARRAELECTPTLRGLADRLRRFLQPLVDGPIYVPEHKALLSVDGGRCPQDGSRLTFDPLSPREHRCPRCGRTYDDELHYRHWIWPYHLWLSERAIHCGVLHALTGEPALALTAREILCEYARRYREYPNRDNTLGPARLFFSTYLESIWLLQVTIAAMLIPRVRGDTFDAMVRESAALIGSFDEGLSNRQVWNNTALVAAGLWLDDEQLTGRGLDGPHGLRSQLRRAVTGEGLWFEGENYHFFALRGFLLAAELLRQAGVDLYADGELSGRLAAMYEAPLATILPDLTLPARGNAPYGVSILQSRFAELWELGWARTASRRVESVLRQLYAQEAPEAADSGFVEIAEQEHNRPAERLGRTRLGWKALLWMKPSPPNAPTSEWQRGACLLPRAGLAVLRPEAARYVSVECGARAGGHGHPDLLHLTLYWGAPLLVDPGTGSYVSRQLHWYRSTLAHNAPGVAGVGQQSSDGWCAAFDQVGEWGWCRTVGRDLLGRGHDVVRSVIAGPRYVLDVIEVGGSSQVDTDLPIHALPRVDAPTQPRRSTQLSRDGAHGHEHGYDAITDVHEVSATGDDDLAFPCGDRLTVHIMPRESERIFLAEAPGPSDARLAEGAPTPFLLRRAAGPGAWVQCYAPTGSGVARLRAVGDEIRILDSHGNADRLAVSETECRIVDVSGRVIRLAGARQAPSPAPARHVEPAVHVLCPRLERVPDVDQWERRVRAEHIVHLDARHYRQSEREHGSHGPFVARVAICAAGHQVCFAANVTKSVLQFRSADAVDTRLDNEPPDIHSDGVQCYLDVGGWQGYLAVPEPSSNEVRVMPVAGTAGDASRVSGTWCRTDRGYRIVVTVNTGREVASGTTFRVNFVVNEMYPERVRRAGQLALANGGGFVYLRGDRESPWLAAEAVVA